MKWEVVEMKSGITLNHPNLNMAGCLYVNILLSLP